MKKLILVLLIATTFSCNVIKNLRKEKSKEETKIEQQTKVDSVAEVEIEKEIVSTFTDETKTEFFDLSTETTTILFNDSGVVKEIITTKKTNIKGNVVAEVKKTPSFKYLLWIILIITGVAFTLVAIWKVKKNNFTQFFK